MVHCFQTAALLIVVALSTTGTDAVAAQHLCGSHLVDALYLVCADEGFNYPKRDLDSLQGKTSRSLEREGMTEFKTRNRAREIEG